MEPIAVHKLHLNRNKKPLDLRGFLEANGLGNHYWLNQTSSRADLMDLSGGLFIACQYLGGLLLVGLTLIGRSGPEITQRIPQHFHLSTPLYFLDGNQAVLVPVIRISHPVNRMAVGQTILLMDLRLIWDCRRLAFVPRS